jgi:hypothetical protein
MGEKEEIININRWLKFTRLVQFILLSKSPADKL